MEFRFERTGQKIFEPVIAVDPLTAYQRFVMPYMIDDDWIEKRIHVTDTKLMPREWLGLALHGLTIMLMTESQKWIGQAEFSDSDGVILEMPSKNRRRTGGYFVEQVLATHRAQQGSVEDTVRAAIEKKSIKKGEQYAANRDLVVLVNK